MIDPNEDGNSHINIYSKGETLLGRFLSNFSHSTFKHPEDGNFESVEGYWYWLSCKNDKLRHCWGYEAKKLGRELGGKDWIEDDGFKEKIKEAIKLKINNDPTKKELFKNSVLPFKHYYNFGGRIIEPKEGKWIIEYLEDLRLELQNPRKNTRNNRCKLCNGVKSGWSDDYFIKTCHCDDLLDDWTDNEDY